MLTLTPVSIAISAILGFLSGLGIGGGSLLMLWLTVVLNTDPQIARATNLLFFIPCAVISSLFRLRQRKLKAELIIPAVLAGCVTAFFGSWLNSHLDVQILRKLFGGLLLLTGLRELFYRPRKAK